MNRGEVWWVDDPVAGARPHLVLTRNAAVPVLKAILGVPVTRTVRGIPTEVAVGVDDDLPDDSVLSLDSTTLIPKAFFRERICQLGPEKMDHVCRALAIATGCA